MFKIFALLESVWNLLQNSYIQPYPSHLRRNHFTTLPWEIKNSNFLQMWKKTQSNCILSTLALLFIHKFYYFPILIANKIFHHCSFIYLHLRLICGTGNSSHHWDITAVFVNNQHGIQRRRPDFYKKKFAFEEVHSKEVDRQISWEKLDKAWC